MCTASKPNGAFIVYCLTFNVVFLDLVVLELISILNFKFLSFPTTVH